MPKNNKNGDRIGAQTRALLRLQSFKYIVKVWGCVIGYIRMFVFKICSQCLSIIRKLYLFSDLVTESNHELLFWLERRIKQLTFNKVTMSIIYKNNLKCAFEGPWKLQIRYVANVMNICHLWAITVLPLVCSSLYHE